MVVMEANDAETKSDDFATLDLVYLFGILFLVGSVILICFLVITISFWQACQPFLN